MERTRLNPFESSCQQDSDRRPPTLVLVFVVCYLVSQSTFAALPKEIRRVLLIYDVGLSYPSSAAADREIRAALGTSRYQVELYPLRDISGQLLHSQDEERRRFARDLHDGTGQYLSGITLSVGQVLADFPRGHDRLRQLLQDSHVASRQALDEIRAISYALHPPILDGLGLIPALQWYLDGLQKRAHLNIDFEAPANLADAGLEGDRTLFRIVQESVTNVLRHSGTTAIKIKVSNGEKRTTVEIQDNGRGISTDDPDYIKGAPSLGVGIAGMRERVRQLGGRLKLTSTSAGTKVLVSLPTREAQYATHTTG